MGHVDPVGPDRAPPLVSPRRWLVLAVLCLVVLAVTLDNTVLSVAVPSIARGLRLSAASLQWVVDAYSLVFAGLLITAGVLSDRFGRRRGLIWGLVVFGTGSAAAAVSVSGPELIAARSLMGIGGAFLMPGTLSILVHTFEGSEQRLAISVWGGMSALGFAIGPVTGGTLVTYFGWHSVFLINLPVVVLAVAGAVVLMAESRDPAAPVPDPLGALLSTAGMAILVWATIDAPHTGWTSGSIVLRFLGGIVCLVLLWWWLGHARTPMISRSLLRRPRFLAAVTVGTLLTLGLGGSLFLLTQDLQFVLGFSALAAGIRTAPAALAVAAATPLSPLLVKRVGDARCVSIGFGLSSIGFAVIGAAPDRGYTPVLIGLLVIGFGAGLAIAPISTCVLAALPRDRAGVGSALNDTAQELGTAIGVALLGSIMASRFREAMPAATPARLLASPADAVTFASSVPGRVGLALREAVNHAMGSGISVGMFIAGAIWLTAAALAFVVLPRDAHDGAQSPEPRIEPKPTARQ